MAGRRDGVVDPLAAAAGVGDKCIVPVGGRPMIAHVLDNLGRTPGIGAIVVSVNDPAVLDGLPEVAALHGRLTIVRAMPNIVDSLLAAVEGAAFPVLVTTADNVLLTPASIAAIVQGAAGADVAVAFTRKASVLAVHRDGQRRFYKFREDAYSNCNAYWLGRPEALKVAETFRSGGQFVKHPRRIVAAFGLLNLIRFRYGLGTLGGLFAQVSRRFRLEVRAVIVEDGAAAIDVDNPRTLGVAESVLAARAA